MGYKGASYPAFCSGDSQNPNEGERGHARRQPRKKSPSTLRAHLPVLAEPARAQNEYFRKTGRASTLDFPRYGLRKLSVSTMKSWLRKYRKEALKPLNQNRSMAARPRRLDEHSLKAIEIKCKAYSRFLSPKTL